MSTSVITIENVPVVLDMPAVAKKLGIKPGQEKFERKLEKLAAIVVEKARPRGVAKVCSLKEIDAEHVEVDGVTMTSTLLPEKMAGLGRVFTFLATEGVELLEWAETLESNLDLVFAGRLREAVCKQYQALLDEKEAVLRSQGGAQSQRLGQLAQEQERTAGELREIQEAIQAGLAAQRALEEMSGDLSGAENWGVWDMVGGGIMATFAKHGCLDDAQDAAYEARRALSRFRTELADVSSDQVPDVELGDFAVFADYFFDGLFADLFVQSRIREAQAQVAAVTQRVERLIVRLRDERENLEEKQGQLDWERERLLTAQNRAQLQSGAETGEAVPV